MTNGGLIFIIPINCNTSSTFRVGLKSNCSPGWGKKYVNPLITGNNRIFLNCWSCDVRGSVTHLEEHAIRPPPHAWADRLARVTVIASLPESMAKFYSPGLLAMDGCDIIRIQSHFCVAPLRSPQQTFLIDACQTCRVGFILEFFQRKALFMSIPHAISVGLKHGILTWPNVMHLHFKLICVWISLKMCFGSLSCRL